jgi:hypothetical protein
MKALLMPYEGYIKAALKLYSGTIKALWRFYEGSIVEQPSLLASPAPASTAVP